MLGDIFRINDQSECVWERKRGTNEFSFSGIEMDGVGKTTTTTTTVFILFCFKCVYSKKENSCVCVYNKCENFV